MNQSRRFINDGTPAPDGGGHVRLNTKREFQGSHSALDRQTPDDAYWQGRAATESNTKPKPGYTLETLNPALRDGTTLRVA